MDTNMKYRVIGAVSATIELGVYEADSPEEAELMAEQDPNSEWLVTVCHQCSSLVELGDVYEVHVQDIT